MKPSSASISVSKVKGVVIGAAGLREGARSGRCGRRGAGAGGGERRRGEERAEQAVGRAALGAHAVGDAEGHLERLPVVEAGVALGRVVAVEIVFAQAAADALGDVFAR